MNAIASILQTPVEAFLAMAKRYPDEVALVQPLGSGKVREYTWAQVEDEARRMASYLRGLGMPVGTNIALMSKNCAEWILADLAIWMAGHVSVPLYPTLTSDTVRQILEHSGSRVLFVGKLDVWQEASRGVPDHIIRIAFSLAPEEALESMPSWDDLVRQHDPVAPVQPDLDDLATLIYTSGTTGKPKGVMQSFRNLAAVGEKLERAYPIRRGDRVISYLPLSHVAERAAVEMAMFYIGLKVYFAESLDTFAEDIKRARPHLFFAVPRIWNKFYQKASEAVPPEKLRTLLRIPLLNLIVRRKILAAMGLDACRIALSGAASLSPDVIHWFKRVGLEILEVYGMTENMAWSHATRAGDQRVGWVGKASEGVECRLGDGGEILVRSPGNMVGYYREPELTREAFAGDGWLRTGDVGEIDDQGRLRITGRVKEIFKTEKGKYVTPAPIENRLVSHPGIEQACVVGPGLPQPIALLNLSPEQADQLAKSGRDEYQARLEQLLHQVNGELDAHERLTSLVVIPEAWTVENGMLTPTLKLKRAVLEKKYEADIPRWARERGVIWA